MKTKLRKPEAILYFSQWSGKEYAVFAALGKSVRIAALAIHVCRAALLKTARKGGIILTEEEKWRKVYELNNPEMEYRYEDQIIVKGEKCPVFSISFSKTIKKDISLRYKRYILFIL